MTSDNAKGEIYYGWVIVAACFLMAATAFGIQYSYSVFFKPLQFDFGWSRATTASVMSLHMLSYGVFALLSGWATDRYGPRITVLVGGGLIGLGLVLSGWIAAVWQLYLLFSLPLAFGMSTCWYPLITTVSRWFTGRRGLALGIVGAGVGLGTLGISPLANHLITTYGWRLSYVIMGLMSWAVILPSALLLRREPQRVASTVPPEEKAPSGPEFSLRPALATRNLWFLVFMQLLCSVSFRMIKVHIVPYATDVEVSKVAASLVLGLIGGFSIGGRLVMGAAQDRFGARVSFIICVLLQSASLFWLITIRDVPTFYGFALIFGFTYGGYLVQFAGLTAGLFGLRYVGAINGAVGVTAGVGGALGPFMAGYIFDYTDSYSIPFFVAAVGLAIAAVLAAWLRTSRRTQEN